MSTPFPHPPTESLRKEGYTDFADWIERFYLDYETTKTSLDTALAAVPIGASLEWHTSTVPNANWMFHDGSSLSTASYPELFAVIKYTWGGSGGSFSLPDYRGRSPMGAGTGSGLTARTIAATAGAETHALVGDENGPHDHTIYGKFNATGGGADRALRGSGLGGDDVLSASSGSGTPHNTVHPIIVVNFIIRVK